MPTVNPRITVTLTPEVAAVLRRMSEATGNSQSAIVGDLLAMSVPVFERMVKVIEAAESAKKHLREDMSAGLEQAQVKLEKQLGLALETMDEGFRPIVDLAEQVQRRRARGQRGDASALAEAHRGGGVQVPRLPAAPMSNRGVTPHPKKVKRR